MSRRAARELTLRALYMVEQSRLDPEDALEQAMESLPRSRSAEPGFASSLVAGVLDNLELIDYQMQPHLRDWSWAQLSAIDRAILRMAGYELLFTVHPIAAVIDEAVSLAKIYGTPESGRFVNGVLGSLIRPPIKTPANSYQHNHRLPDAH